jgi:hypothetical protein
MAASGVTLSWPDFESGWTNTDEREAAENDET